MGSALQSSNASLTRRYNKRLACWPCLLSSGLYLICIIPRMWGLGHPTRCWWTYLMLSLNSGSMWSCMQAHCVTVTGVTATSCPMVVRCGFVKLYTRILHLKHAGDLKLQDRVWLWDLTVYAGYRLVIRAVCGYLLSHREPFSGRSGCGTEPRDPAATEAGVWRPTDPAQEQPPGV